jgi:hypothetical protein
MTPLIYVLMFLAGDPGSLESFCRDEQSCVIVRGRELLVLRGGAQRRRP